MIILRLHITTYLLISLSVALSQAMPIPGDLTQPNIGYFEESRYTGNEDFFVQSPDGLLTLAKAGFNQHRNYSLARLLLRQLILRYPDYEHLDEAMYYLGRIYYQAEDYENAAGAFETAARVGKDADMIYQGTFWAGKSYFSLQKDELALKQFGAAMLMDLASEEATSLLFWIARTYFRLGRYEEASSLFQSQAFSGAHHQIAPYFYYFSTQSLLGLGDYTKAVSECREFLSTFPSHPLAPEIYFSLTLAYSNLDQPDSTLAFADSCLSRSSYCYHDSLGNLQLRPADEHVLMLSEKPELWWVDDVYFLYAWQSFLSGKTERAFYFLEHFSDYFPTSSWRFLGLYYAGTMAYEKGDFEQVAHLMTQFVDKFPQNPLAAHALYRKAWALHRLDQNKQACEVFESVQKKYPSSPLYAETLFSAAELNYYADTFDKSRENYLEIIQTFSKTSFYPDALYGAAWCYFQQKQYKDAYDYFELFKTQAVEGRQREIANFRAALALFYDGRYEKAIAAFEVFLQGNEADPFADQARFRIAEAYFELENYESAIESYQLLLKTYPDSPNAPRALAALGQTYFNQKKYRQAIQNLEQLEKYDNPLLQEEGWYLIERALFQLGVYSHPSDILRNYIKKHPNSERAPKLQKELAYYYYQNQQYHQAIEEYKNLILKYSGNPMQPEAEHMIGVCHFQLKDYDAAREWFGYVLKRRKETSFHAASRFYLGKILALEGNDRDAFKEFEAVVTDYPASKTAPLALQEIADSYSRLRKWDEAKLVIKRLIDNYPDSNNICSARLKLITIEIALGEPNELSKNLSALTRASCPEESMLEALSTMADFYFDNQNFKEAEDLFEEIYIKYSRFEEARCKALYKAARCAVFFKHYSVARDRLGLVLQGDCDYLNLIKESEKLLEIIKDNG